MADKTDDDTPMPQRGMEHFAHAALSILGTAAGADCQVPQHICFVCGKTKTKDGKALMMCGNCGSARYCSRECQKQAWKEHKIFCNFTKQGKELKEKVKQASEEPSELQKRLDGVSPAMQAVEEYLEQATGMPSMLNWLRMSEQVLKKQE